MAAPHFAEPLTCFHQDTLVPVLDELSRTEYRALRLDGAQVTDKPSLLAQAARDLPMPEGLYPGNWDALADCLWGGLGGLAEDRLAIVWSRADVLLGVDLKTLLQAVGILVDAVRALETKQLRIVLVGEGAMFPPFARG